MLKSPTPPQQTGLAAEVPEAEQTPCNAATQQLGSALSYPLSLEITQSHKHSLPQNFYSMFTLRLTSCGTSSISFLPTLSLFTLVLC